MVEPRAGWDGELDRFEVRVEAIERALAARSWDRDPAGTWSAPAGLDPRELSPEHVDRLSGLVERADRARATLRVELAAVGNAMGGARRSRAAARSYASTEVRR